MKSPKQKTEDEIKELEAAKAQARESAEKNRNLLFGSLLIFAFLILVVLQTSDVDLLLGKAIKLPVIDVDIPLFAFYLLSSPLAFLVHLNLLRNIEAHAVKLKAWEDADENKLLEPADLFPFIFDFAVVDQESPMAGPTRWFSQLVIYWLGTLTLLLIFWRFTDYQHPWITGFHAILLIIDLFVLRIIRQQILDILHDNTLEETEDEKPSRIKQWIPRFLKVAIFSFGGWTCTTKGKGEWLGQIIGFLIILAFYAQVTLFIIFIFLLPHNYHKFIFSNCLEEKGHNLQDSLDDRSKFSYCIDGESLNLKVKDVPFFHAFFFSVPAHFFPILIIHPHQNLLVFDESLLRLQYDLSSDAEEKFGQWFMGHGVGLDLRDRNLRYAQLGRADLRKTQLFDADLFEANLYQSNLKGVNLEYANLQGADLRKAELQGADLDDANLQGADLDSANLKGAYLENAKLQGAGLKDANLQGADLEDANLQGAYLENAKLQGADLEDANLQGVTLFRANLQDADLIWAELQGANLGSAELQGADLRWAELQGAYLSAAELQGADLDDANLQGADLQVANLQGVGLEDAELQGAYLRGAELRGADLRSAKLPGADLTDAIIQDVFTDKDTQWIGEDDTDWQGLRQLADTIEFSSNPIIAADEMKQKYLERLDDAEARIKEGNQERPNLESVSSERLIETLTKTLCNMESEPRKYTLEGVIRNYKVSPAEETTSIYNHFKALEGALDC